MSPTHERLIPLGDLDPHFLPDPRPRNGGRWRTGIGFVCPLHRDHRVYLYMKHPLDGGHPEGGGTLYDFELMHSDNEDEVPFELSVFGKDDTAPLVMPCGARFWLVGGAVILARHKWWEGP